jgi:hypothetical protein
MARVLSSLALALRLNLRVSAQVALAETRANLGADSAGHCQVGAVGLRLRSRFKLTVARAAATECHTEWAGASGRAL